MGSENQGLGTSECGWGLGLEDLPAGGRMLSLGTKEFGARDSFVAEVWNLGFRRLVTRVHC